MLSQILGSRDAVKNHGLVPGQSTEKLNHSGIA